LIFEKGGQNMLKERELENWISTCKRLRPDPSPLPCTHINSKQIKDLNLKSETTTGKQGAPWTS
jgi:hypothetical protein